MAYMGDERDALIELLENGSKKKTITAPGIAAGEPTPGGITIPDKPDEPTRPESFNYEDYVRSTRLQH